MASILRPGYVRWDGLKYVLDPDVEIVGPPGPPGKDGTSGGNLVYRPGGVTLNNVFAVWSDLMAVRSTIQGPVLIEIDSSITSPAVIGIGTWNLGDNTKIIGHNFAQMTIPTGAVLLNPSEFENLTINLDSSNFAMDFTSTPGGRLNLKFKDCTVFGSTFATGGINLSSPSVTPPQFVEFYGVVNFRSPGYIMNIGANNVSFTLFDYAAIDTVIAGSSGSVNAYVASHQAVINTPQIGGLTVNFIDGFEADNFALAANGSVLTKVGPGEANWLPAAATLAGDVTGPIGSNTVEQITGNGGNVDILCAQTTNIANVHYQPLSIQSEQLVSSGSINLVITGTPANSGVQVDVALTAISSSDFASWKLSIAAYNNGSTTVAVGAIPAPGGVLPDRYTAGAGAWLATLTLSAGTISLAIVSVASGARAGFTYQVLPLAL